MNKLLKIIILLIAVLSSQKLCAQFNIDASKLCAEPKYDYVYKDTIIMGGDGCRLVTEIYLPKGEGPWPIVVTRTPYVRHTECVDDQPLAREYARRGMGYIRQRCRGTDGSEGTYEPNIYEREDGLALLNWLDAQPWCKNIGLTGMSYGALVCWIVADAVPEKVKGIHMHHYGVDRHLSAYCSGLFRQDILTSWAIENAKEPINKPVQDPIEPFYDKLRYRPQASMAVDMLGCEMPWYRDWITHTDYTDPYWHEGVWETLRNIPEKIKIPVTIVAGFFDHHMEGTVLGYELLSDEIKAKSRLIVGSWNHYYQTTPTAHNPKNDHEL
ncbi:MAG: CocE/NonD family hydrolase, partial [Bacteroidales bacterium]|nr:CocE/NonD family hydrolase [Bacteroidales bacterium]